MKYPVIMILDSDEGAKGVLASIKDNLKKDGKISQLEIKVKDNQQDFYHLKDNLYLVKVPVIQNKETSIEHLFQEDLLKSILPRKDGKGELIFNMDEKTFDANKNYGKKIFAEKIVKKKENNVDFFGFDPLLSRICAAIDDWDRISHKKIKIGAS